MSSPALTAWNHKLQLEPDLQVKVELLQSPMDLFALAKEQGIELSGADLQTIAQTSFHQWIEQLSGTIREFFQAAQTTSELNQRLKVCRTPEAAISLGKEYGFEFTEADLLSAARAAQNVAGFSFEKLWFKGLGLI